jgi:UDPglucose 6-dehydrogenase
LETHSGRICGDSFGVCYNPEFVALGSVLHDLLNPDFVLIGESDKKAGDTLSFQVYEAPLHAPSFAVRRMNFVNAEIAKLALNCYITMKISYANLLGNLCEEIPGANAHTVTDAIGLDRRIGRACLKPATAYGGPYFPRDVEAFNEILASISFKENTVGVPDLSDLFEAVSVINSQQTQRLVDIVEKHSPQEAKVAVLGLAYKPGTHVTEESVGLDLIRLLLNRGREVVAWDPMVTKTGIATELDEVLMANSLEDCVKDVDVVVVTIPCEEFKDLPIYREEATVVIDPWGVVQHPYDNYLRTGVCQKESER